MLIHTNFLTLISNLFCCCLSRKIIVYPYKYMNNWKKINESSLKRGFLQWFKHGGYYWCRLRTRKKNLWRFWNKTFRWIPCIFEAVHYWYLIYLTTFRICIFKYFLFAPGLVWQAVLKKTLLKLDLLTDMDMFLMI